MSTLKVNNIEPTSGNSVTVNSELLIKGPGGDIVIGSTGSSNLSASYAATAGCASNINISTIVPGDTTTSVVLVGDQAVGCQSPFIDSGLTYNASTNILNATVTTAQTASYVNTLNQNVTINGNVTASGDIRLTTSGSAVVRPIISLVPNGTASFNPNLTNTTAYANYGINVISTVTSQSYCLRLPQTPTQGKTVTIINKGGMDVLVFPSIIGGDVNGIINGYFTIPSDGKSYSFDCYENPLPGGWSVTSNTATTSTITTGVINYNYTSSAGYIAFVNDSCKVSGSGLNSGNTFNGLLSPQYKTYKYNNSNTIGGQIFSDAVPTQNIWSSIDSIQILTNISYSSCQASMALSQGSNIEYYYAGTTNQANAYIGYYNAASGVSASLASFITNVVNPWFTSHPGTGNNNFGMFAAINQISPTPSIIPGTFTSSSQSPYTSTNVGDPGTLVLTFSYLSTFAYGPSFKMIGRNYIGTYVHPFEGPLDAYYNFAFGPMLGLSIYDPSFNPIAAVPNVKFQAFYNVSL
jgi:hypothetical protein